MQTDSIISDKVEKSEEILAGQLGGLEQCQELLGRSHSDGNEVRAAIAQARGLLAKTGAALLEIEDVIAAESKVLDTHDTLSI